MTCRECSADRVGPGDADDVVRVVPGAARLKPLDPHGDREANEVPSLAADQSSVAEGVEAPELLRHRDAEPKPHQI